MDSIALPVQSSKKLRRQSAVDLNLNITSKYTLHKANPISIRTMPKPSSQTEKTPSYAALVVTESKAQELAVKSALPKFTSKRNPHNSMSIRHHIQ
jgi:hypothetical protein